jgi:hypothetical protein
LMYFLYMYEYGTLKQITVISRRGIKRGRLMEGMNQLVRKKSLWVPELPKLGHRKFYNLKSLQHH